jgi:hypothetical protein
MESMGQHTAVCYVPRCRKKAGGVDDEYEAQTGGEHRIVHLEWGM